MAAAADRARTPGPLHAWYKRCRTCCAVLAGVVLLALGFMTSVLYFHFTPLCTKIKCTLDPIKFKKVSFSGGFNLDLNISTTCHNPNPYRVKVESLDQEAVFVGRGMVPAATVLEMPHAMLPADGWGSIQGIINIRPTRQVFPSLATLLLQGEVPLYLENKKQLTLHINFIFALLRVQLDFNKACAAKVRLLGLTRAKLGPPACGNTYGELELPSVRLTPERGSAPVWPQTRGENTIEKVELAKDALFGLIMCICYMFGLLLVCVKYTVLKWGCRQTCMHCCCCCCPCPFYDEEDDGDEDDDPEVHNAAVSDAADKGCSDEDAGPRERTPHAPPSPPPPPPRVGEPQAGEAGGS